MNRFKASELISEYYNFEPPSFDDVLLVPTYSSLSSRLEPDIGTKLSSNFSLKVPVISSPMDTVTESAMAQKRNEAIQQSSGEYICFVDDDDIVSSDYVSKILDALKTNPDCVGIHLLHFNDGNLAGFTYHSLKYNKWFEERDMTTGLMRYYRNPNHLNPVKRELALQTPFPEVDWGEDRDYSQRILKLLNTEEYVTEPIYYYMFRSKK